MKMFLIGNLLLLLVSANIFPGGSRDSPAKLLDRSDRQEMGEVEFEENREITQARGLMVYEQIEARGISDRRVLEAMTFVPRHLFMPKDMAGQAYEDHPVPIGEGQTISQPYIVALMTESLMLEEGHRILEIGTGSGYQAAVLSRIVDEVYTIEIKKLLHERSTRVLSELQYTNVKTKHADGYFGWEEYAPFDAIMITAAVDHIPRALLDQLAEGGRLVLPLGDPFGFQDLVLIRRRGDEHPLEYITGVLFVPMTGRALD